LRPQVGNLGGDELEREILGKALTIAFERFVKSFSRHAIQPRQIRIEHDPAAANREDQRRKSFMGRRRLSGGHPGSTLLCGPPESRQPRSDRLWTALVRYGQLTRRLTRVESRKQLVILVRRPRRPCFAGNEISPPILPLGTLERAHRSRQRAHGLRPLNWIFRIQELPAFRIHAIRQRPQDHQCLQVLHLHSLAVLTGFLNVVCPGPVDQQTPYGRIICMSYPCLISDKLHWLGVDFHLWKRRG